MKHPHRDLLIAYANDVDVRFTSDTYCKTTTADIQTVLAYPNADWKLVDKFAELKKAYVEGKTIQARLLTEFWNDLICPNWDSNVEYRIKPEPVYEWQWLLRDKGNLYISQHYITTPPKYETAEVLYRIEESKREVKA